jgi:NAD(P)-dependent dehydrogenase (short-subunit alcohol dehydrogenase family)
MIPNGKNIFVTGAGRGLGKALVEAALQSGAQKVYAAARKVENLTPWGGGRVVPVRLDVSDGQSIQAAARFANDIDILVNNAASQISEETWRRTSSAHYE